MLARRLATRCSSTASSSTAIYDYVRDLERRDLIANSYPAPLLGEHDAHLKQLPRGLYAGFDPTAPSLHVGNLLILVNLFRSARFGCQPIALVGGATALVGDPSGRSTDRDASRLHEALENKHKVALQIKSIWRRARDEGPLRDVNVELTFVDNAEWYENMRLLEFLSLTRPLRVGEMLRTKAIRARLDAGAGGGVSFPEFVYQSLQAYDWKRLADSHDCQFQLGGSDQLGHLDIGAHFIGRTSGRPAAGVCLPLLTDSAGNKLGKSTGGGGAWLDGEKTSPYHFYQLFRQLHDDEAALMLKRCSLRPTEEVEALLGEHEKKLGSWLAQTALAEEMTGIVHGSEAVVMAQRASKALFHGSMDDVEALPPAVLEDVFGVPLELRRDEVRTYGALADSTRQDKQKGSKLMKTGAFKVNGVKRQTADEAFTPEGNTLSNAPSLTLIGWGKRKFLLVSLTRVTGDIMADTKVLPVFCFTDDPTQLRDIRAYLNKHGASLDATGPEDVAANLLQIVQSVDILGAREHEADMLLSSISSLFAGITEDKAEEIVAVLVTKIKPETFRGVGWGSAGGAAVRVLSNLFRGFPKNAKIQEAIFVALLEMCRSTRLIGEMDTAPQTLQDYFKAWSTTTDGQRRILRALNAALLADNRADQAAKVMITLLGTYTDADAASAIEDARECVRTAVVDPKSFSFDHIVRLKAVQQLEAKDPVMHSALALFASGTYKDYQAFVAKHPAFVSDKLHVAESVLVKKMRLLTLMSTAESDQTIPLSRLSAELGITDDEELEEFIIEAIQVNAVSGKLNEQTRTFHVSSFQHRAFGREQWQALQTRLRALIESVKQSHTNIKNVNDVTLVH